MNKIKFKIEVFLIVCLIGNSVFAADDSQKDLSWLKDFFAKGIQSAEAQYSYLLDAPNDKSEKFYKRSSYSVQYSFAEKKYTYSFIYEYQDFWSALTNNNTTDPPKQEVRFVGSKINHWKMFEGIGSYSEEYEKILPNWFVFDDLDSLMIKQCMMNNPLPAITGIFYADELKALKRINKTALANNEYTGISSFFEFDKDGNVVEISRAHLGDLSPKSLNKDKNFEEYSILVRNNNNEVIFIDILTSARKPLLLEGISVKHEERKINIYNFEINSLLHKFVPELIADPRELIQSYLVELQKESDKGLVRFETTGNK